MLMFKAKLLELDERPDDIEVLVHLVADQLGQDLGQGPPDRLDRLKYTLFL